MSEQIFLAIVQGRPKWKLSFISLCCGDLQEQQEHKKKEIKLAK